MAMNQSSSSRMVTGLFRDRDSAERAYSDISARGYGKDDVNLVMSDETRKRHFLAEGAPTTELGSKAAEGAGIGGESALHSVERSPPSRRSVPHSSSRVLGWSSQARSPQVSRVPARAA